MWWRAVTGSALGPAWGSGLSSIDPQVAFQARHVPFLLRSGIQYASIELNGLECDPRNFSSEMTISFVRGCPILVHTIEDVFLEGVEVTAIGELALAKNVVSPFLPPSILPTISSPVVLRASSSPVFLKSFITERNPLEIAADLKKQGRFAMWLGCGLVISAVVVLGASGWNSVKAALRRQAEAAQRNNLLRRLAENERRDWPDGRGEEEEDDEEEGDPLCVVCLERGRDAVLLPCAHQVVCEVCARSLPRVRTAGGRAAQCPICRNPIESLLRVNTIPSLV